MDFALKRRQAFEYLCSIYKVTVDDQFLSRRRVGPDEGCWSVTVDLEVNNKIEEVELTLCIPPDFPLSIPRAYLTKAGQVRFGPLPHVDGTGFICTFESEDLHPNVDQPGLIAAAIVVRATRLLNEGINSENVQEFEEEYLAYWELEWGTGDAVQKNWLSLIDRPPEQPVRWLELGQPLGRFHHVLHAGGVLMERIFTLLDERGIEYGERDVFYLNEAPFPKPPFDVKNGDVLRVIDECGLAADFNQFVDSHPQQSVVVFRKHISGRDLFLGWRHQMPKTQRDGFRGGALKPSDVLGMHERGRPVIRLASQPYTPDRMQLRTSGHKDTSRGPSLFIAGLGSIGSNLTNYFARGIASELSLLDPDKLSIENVGRHFLGLTYAGQNKATAMKKHFQDADPLLPVRAISDKRLAHALLTEPDLFDPYDRVIVSIGDTATELWLDGGMQAGRITTPLFYIWVEPYLAGGHCIYIRPNEGSLCELFNASFYKHNVITQGEYATRSFTKREAGCQTAFTPYQGSHVIRFVAASFPYILDASLSDANRSFRLTWTGDLNMVKEKGIEVTEHAETIGSFSTIVKNV